MEDLSVFDECMLLGALEVMRKNVKYLDRKVHKAVANYDATDCDDVTMLADIAYALDQNEVVLSTARKVAELLGKLRKSVMQ